MSRTIGAVLLGFIFAVSGCVDSGTGPKEQPSGIPEQAAPAQFDESTGAITGIVTDDEFQALAGAQAGLRELPERSTLTDVGGAFTLSSLPPGTYTMDVNALGYVATARKVTVVAGRADSVSIRLVALPVLEPYHLTHPFTGFIDCATAIIRTTHYPIVNCPSQLTPADTTNFHDIHPNGWPTTWVGTMVEAEWNSQANPDWLAFDYNDRGIGYFGVYYRYRGTSPVQFFVERCGDYRPENFGRAPVPCTDDQVNASKMHVETFYVGKFQQETHNADAVCRENVTNPTGGNVLPGYQAGCYGVGLGVGLRWENWVTAFHVELPPDLDRFSARPDG